MRIVDGMVIKQVFERECWDISDT